jgi:DNA processing protein
MASGRTVAVIAGGLDVPYPPEHEKLQARIAENGAVLAEAPLGTAPLGRHFPRRNRNIAGLVLGLVVIEAAPRSGSLLTARLANEAGRELFAVPGSPLDPRCRGSNDLIRQGANLTESAQDVLANLPDHPLRQGLARDPLFVHQRSGFAEPARAGLETDPETRDLSAARARLPGLIGPDPVAVDEIARRCQLSASAISAVLLELELAGRVETLPGNRVALLASP